MNFILYQPLLNNLQINYKEFELCKLNSGNEAYVCLIIGDG